MTRRARTLRLPEAVDDALTEQARESGLSTNALITLVLSRFAEAGRVRVTGVVVPALSSTDADRARQALSHLPVQLQVVTRHGGRGRGPIVEYRVVPVVADVTAVLDSIGLTVDKHGT